MQLIRLIVSLALCLQCTGTWADAMQDANAALHRKDYATAARRLEPLARAGDAPAQVRLGLLHYHGHGVPESDAQAAAWFQRAATQGSAEGQLHLANLYAYGLALPPQAEDPQRAAARWYFEAARQGHAEAQYSLAVMFLTGSGVTLSADEARKWMGRAAAQGHTDAQAWLQGQPK